MTRELIAAKFVESLDDPQREWYERQMLKRIPAAAGAAREPDPVWVHPDGCRSAVAGRAMYPICEHGSRATFIGHAGDGYVLGARS